MQRCEKCGQMNYNSAEKCIYCNHYFFISVDHDNQNYSTHRHGTTSADITNEIIEELSNSNNDAAEYFDIDDNPFTKSIESNSYYEEEDFINHRDDQFHDVEIKTNNNQSFDNADLYDDVDSTENLINDEDSYGRQSYSDTFDENPFAIEEERRDVAPKKQHLIDLENDLKRKIKRNKRLENSIGIAFGDIEVEVSSITSPIIISGKAFFNTNEITEDYQLSIICYDVLKNKLGRKDLILKNSQNKEYVEFRASINPNIHKTAMIILLPEIIEEPLVSPDDIETNDDEKDYSYGFVKNIFIEQMNEIERKIGMKIDNTSVILKSDQKIEIVGEIYIKDPEKYNTIKITATCYDKDGYIIATESTKINTKLYLGFDTLRLIVNHVNVRKIQRIKLYPTLQGLDY